MQGSTLKTWDIGEESTQRVQLSLRSEGRPIDANIELWHTPSYIPTKFRIYTEDGVARPVDAVIETPKHPKTVAVYNTGPTQTLTLGPNPFVPLALALALALAPTLTRAPNSSPRPLGSLEFPFDAAVANTGLGKAYESLSHIDGALVQGGQITSYTFPTEVGSTGSGRV